MAKSLFRVGLGVNIDNKVWHIAGSGVPGGTTETDNAPKGSLYHNTDTGASFKKITAGAGTDKWSEQVDKAYVDSVASGLSWREPARVIDATTYADQAAAEAAVNTGTIDGVAIADGDRILFTGIQSPGGKNVWTVSGTPGAGATLVEDSNQESDGDAIYIQEGTQAGKQYSYNSTDWFQVGGTASSELGWIQNFIGKDADGNEMPTYANTNYVTSGTDSLESAIGILDGQIKTNADNITSATTAASNAQAELDATQVGIGASIDPSTGNYVAHTGKNYINGNTSITQDIIDLDAQLKVASDLSTANQTEINNIEASIGSLMLGDGTFDGFSLTNYLDSTTSVTDAFTTLDTQVKANADAIAALGGSSGITLDTVDYMGNAASLSSYTNGSTHNGKILATGDTIFNFDTGAIFTVQAAGAPTETTPALALGEGSKIVASRDGSLVSGTPSSSSFLCYEEGGTRYVGGISESDAAALQYNESGANKTIQAKLDEIGALTALTTDDKTSIVSAINELQSEVNDNVLTATGVDFTTVAASLSGFTNGSTIYKNTITAGQTIMVSDGVNAGAIYTVQASGAPTLTTAAPTSPKLFRVYLSSDANNTSGTYLAYDNGGSIVLNRISDNDSKYLEFYGDTAYKTVETKLLEVGELTDLTTSDQTSIVNAINELDSQLGSTITSVEVTGITTATEVDSVLVDEVATAKWIISVFEEGTPTNKVATEVLALHDGTAAADATVADFTEYARLKLGSKIQGLQISTQVSGTGVTQKMQLMVTATNAVTVKATRLKVE